VAPALVWQTALGSGARDAGAPGVRAQYHPNYYGSFVIDPEGHPIEAVFHGPAVKAKPKSKSSAKLKVKTKAQPKKVRR
jgi:hypothetical protein